MPAPRLNETEAARVNKGLCACGCGEKLPTVTEYDYSARKNVQKVAEGVCYVSGAHRQRAWRQRGLEGRVWSPEQRRADTLRREAQTWRQRAEMELEQAKHHKAIADRHLAEATRLEAEADGQLRLFEERKAARDTKPKASRVSHPAGPPTEAELARMIATCPACGAGPGSVCKSYVKAGRMRRWPDASKVHPERIPVAAQKQREIAAMSPCDVVGPDGCVRCSLPRRHDGPHSGSYRLASGLVRTGTFSGMTWITKFDAQPVCGRAWNHTGTGHPCTLPAGHKGHHHYEPDNIVFSDREAGPALPQGDVARAMLESVAEFYEPALLAVGCPLCAAAPGFPCVTREQLGAARVGRPVSPHRDRRVAAKRSTSPAAPASATSSSRTA